MSTEYGECIRLKKKQIVLDILLTTLNGINLIKVADFLFALSILFQRL